MAEERQRQGRARKEGGENEVRRGAARPRGPKAPDDTDGVVIADLDSPAARPRAAAGPVRPGTVDGVADASPALTQALLAVAEDAADEQTVDDESGGWAALLRDGEEIARSVSDPDVIAEVAPAAGEIDPDEWERLRASSGVVVLRDARGRASARIFSSSDDLWAEWTRVMAEVSPEQPGPGTTRSPESDDNPE